MQEEELPQPPGKVRAIVDLVGGEDDFRRESSRLEPVERAGLEPETLDDLSERRQPVLGELSERTQGRRDRSGQAREPLRLRLERPGPRGSAGVEADAQHIRAGAFEMPEHLPQQGAAILGKHLREVDRQQGSGVFRGQDPRQLADLAEPLQLRR